MNCIHKKSKGWITLEVFIALAVLALIIACLASSTLTFGKINRRQFAKQRCVAAAEAVLDSITVKTEFLNEDKIKMLWPEVQIEIEETKGTDQWQGLTLVKVTAQDKLRRVSVTLSRFTHKKEDSL